MLDTNNGNGRGNEGNAAILLPTDRLRLQQQEKTNHTIPVLLLEPKTPSSE